MIGNGPPGGRHTDDGNPLGYLYINGDAQTEGSRRFAVDSETGYAIIEKLIDGIWQPTSLETGATSVWVGKNVAVAGLGHHLATEAADGHLHFHAHSEFDGELSVSDASVLNAYSYTEHMAVVPDESGEWTGTIYNYNYPSADHRMFKNVYFKTGAVAATAPVRFRVWEGTDDTGVYIFDQSYPASEFPADTEIIIAAAGYLEFDTGQNYYIRVSSDETFSLKTTADKLYPYTYGDISLLHEDNILQTAPYIDGDTYAAGQYLINDRKIYVCNTAGVQTGTFASNVALWDGMGHSGSHYWTRTGSVLSPSNPGDILATTGRMNLGDGTLATEKLLIEYDEVGTNILKVSNPNTGDASANVQVKADVAGVNLRAFGSGNSSPNAVWIDAFNNTGPLTIKSHTNIILRTGINTEALLVGDDGTLVFNDGTLDRLEVANNLVQMSADVDDYISVKNTEFKSTVAAQTRILVNTSGTYLNSPSATLSTLNVNNSGVTTTAPYFRHNDKTRDRIKLDATDSRLISPDGSKLFILTNSGASLPDGSTAITQSPNDNSTKLATTAYVDASSHTNHWAVASAELKNVAGPTKLTFNDGTRDKLKIQAETSSTGFIYTDDNGLERIQSASDHTAMKSPGDVNSHTTIQVMENTVDLKVGLSSRQTINNSMTKMWDNAGGTFKLQDGTLAHNDGTRDRIVADTGKTELVSPDGSKKITLTNGGGLVASGPIVAEDTYVYIGDPNTNGSGRMYMIGSTITFDTRASGVWNTVGGFS